MPKIGLVYAARCHYWQEMSLSLSCSHDCLALFIKNTSVLFRHVIVGRNFGSYVTHESNFFIYFYLGQVAILIFKSG